MIRLKILACPAAVALLAGTALAQQTIKVGVNEPLTGPFAASVPTWQRRAIAADEINAKGGVLGKKIELVIEDNKSNPTEAAAVAEKLIIRDKVPVMMGAWGSSLTLAVMPKLDGISGADAGRDVLVRQDHHIGQPIHFPHLAALVGRGRGVQPMVEKMGEEGRFPRHQQRLGARRRGDFGKMFKAHNVQVGLVETMDQEAQDMSAQLAKIKASDADTLMVTTAVEQLTLVFKQAAGARPEEADHHDRRLADPRPADRPGGRRRKRHEPPRHLRALEARPTPNPAGGEIFHRRMEEARLRLPRRDRSFRGYDGIRTIAAAIARPREGRGRGNPRRVLEHRVTGLNGESVSEAGSGRQGKRPERADVYLIRIEDGKVVVPNDLIDQRTAS